MVKLAGNATKKEVSAERFKALKKEVSRKASMANKRLRRLEKNGLTSTPAYKNWKEYGGGKNFSVKGKDYNQLQQELARVNMFIDAKTSTVRGSNKVIKEMARNAGIKYKSLSELYSKSGKFFELASKVEQYMKNVNASGQVLGYQKLWETINEYTQSNDIDLADEDTDIDSYIKEISDSLSEQYDKQAEEDFEEFDMFDL